MPSELRNSRQSSFPPYPQLPTTYIYPVPNTDVILNFTAQKETFDPDRSETEVRDVLAQAFVDNIRHTDRQAVIPPEMVEYIGGGNVFMELHPYNSEGGQAGLTWEICLQALNGVASFAHAYPGLYFGFYIYLSRVGPRENFIGGGALISFF